MNFDRVTGQLLTGENVSEDSSLNVNEIECSEDLNTGHSNTGNNQKLDVWGSDLQMVWSSNGRVIATAIALVPTI